MQAFKNQALETKHTDKHPIDLTTEVLATFPNGGKVVVYNAIDRSTADFCRILSCARFFAKQGKQVVMPPKLDVPYKNPAYEIIFGTLRGTPYYGKCPDLLVNGVWYEHEGFSGEKPKRSFRNMCYHGLRQCDRLILENCVLTFGFMYRSLLGRIKRGEKIKEVWVHSQNDMHLLYKAE